MLGNNGHLRALLEAALYGFFAFGSAFGFIYWAMIEVTARGSEFENGDKVGTWHIRRYSDAYEQRR